VNHPRGFDPAKSVFATSLCHHRGRGISSPTVVNRSHYFPRNAVARSASPPPPPPPARRMHGAASPPPAGPCVPPAPGYVRLGGIRVSRKRRS